MNHDGPYLVARSNQIFLYHWIISLRTGSSFRFLLRFALEEARMGPNGAWSNQVD